MALSPFQPECPKCLSETGRLIAPIAEYPLAHYFRCITCGHVWVVMTDDPTHTRHDVTVRLKAS